MTDAPRYSNEKWVEIAQGAYMAYGGTTNFLNYQGLPMPKWDDLTDKIRATWVASVQNTYALISQDSGGSEVGGSQTNKPMNGLTVGRIVHYVMKNGEHRAAMIVRVVNEVFGYVNLQVFTDGMNDVYAADDVNTTDLIRHGLLWVGTVYFDENGKEGTWHWIEKA